MKKKSFIFWAVALVMMFSAGVSASQEVQAVTTQEMTTISGALAAINVASGQIMVNVESGETLLLTMGEGFDVKEFGINDQVTIAYDKDKVIQSITRQTD